MPSTPLKLLANEISDCRACPRLVAWREQVASSPPKRFAGQAYWARPVPGWGDPAARIVIVGLAPAAHGANRTGRMFTGDRSGDWLYAALHRAGLASAGEATARDDGLELLGCWVTAVVRCAPPDNKPTPTERDTCLPYLVRELTLLSQARTIVALGAFAWNGAIAALKATGEEIPKPKPRFAHGACVQIGPYTLLGSYHVSQQNTFTGRLTEPMLDAVLAVAVRSSNGSAEPRPSC